MCVTDVDADVRLCVLASLDEAFDGHLAQAENLKALIYALSDEVFEIRELAITTLGRLRWVHSSEQMYLVIINVFIKRRYHKINKSMISK